MTKSPAERKAAQRARQAVSGSKKLELALDSQELQMLAQNCAARHPSRKPYELNEYITMLIRKDAAEMAQQLETLVKRQCGKCGDQLPVSACPCQGKSTCRLTNSWHEMKLMI